MHIDHLVLSVSNLKTSTKFYEQFLGKAIKNKEDSSWMLGSTKLFLAPPYKTNHGKFDKDKLGLNHIAFRVKSVKELEELLKKLTKAKIKHSGIQTDKFGGNKFIWFNDLDSMRLEFYLR